MATNYKIMDLAQEREKLLKEKQENLQQIAVNEAKIEELKTQLGIDDVSPENIEKLLGEVNSQIEALENQLNSLREEYNALK